jgi:hypothetical protein
LTSRKIIDWDPQDTEYPEETILIGFQEYHFINEEFFPEWRAKNFFQRERSTNI